MPHDAVRLDSAPGAGVYSQDHLRNELARRYFPVYLPARDGHFVGTGQRGQFVADSMTADGINLELFFVTEVLQLNSLHYGYWAEPSTAAHHILDLRDIQQAQESYTRELLQVIPADVQSVLDVGCGIGDNARAMLSR
ncbi:MAG: hypothetical protein H0W66_01855, partial [Chthoniobacterales bacterium]|nr:hypothetical protein [Chthoniobacterales bacterium]